MARLLFIIEDRFTVRGRGVVVLPGIVPQGDERFRVGDTVELRKPDRTNIVTRIGGLEFMSPMPANHAISVLLPNELTKDDVPVGTEVWSLT
jgi:hypothetical protein